MFKKLLAVLGAVVLIVCTSQLLWGGGGGEEYPWGNSSIGNGGTGGSTVGSEANTRTGLPISRIYIVRPAPMGGFYIIRVSLASGASAKTTTGGKKVEN